MQQYDVNYFIDKFSKLNNWCTGTYHDGNGNHCALGHCKHGSDATIIKSLENIFKVFYRGIHWLTPIINDGEKIYINKRWINFKEFGDTPKERILNVLNMIKEKEELEKNEKELDNSVIFVQKLVNTKTKELVNI